jgi:hypothetical protein
VYKTVGFYLLLRFGAKCLVSETAFEFFSKWFKRLVGESTTDKAVQDAALALEVNAVVGFNLFLLRRCFYSFFLEFLAD